MIWHEGMEEFVGNPAADEALIRKIMNGEEKVSGRAYELTGWQMLAGAILWQAMLDGDDEFLDSDLFEQMFDSSPEYIRHLAKGGVKRYAAFTKP